MHLFFWVFFVYFFNFIYVHKFSTQFCQMTPKIFLQLIIFCFICLVSQFLIIFSVLFPLQFSFFNVLQRNSLFFFICQIVVNFDWFLFNFIDLNSFFVNSWIFSNSIIFYLFFFAVPNFKFQLKFIVEIYTTIFCRSINVRKYFTVDILDHAFLFSSYNLKNV